MKTWEGFKMYAPFRNSFINSSKNKIESIIAAILYCYHGLGTPNEGIPQRNLKFWAECGRQISFGHSKK